MYLYLVQHAEAKSKQEDPERPLSEQGYANIRKVAAFVAQNAALQVGQIIHSGKTRARQTAEVLAEALSPAQGMGTSSDLAPLAEPSIWAGQLANVQSATMLVGHLPHLSKLATLLVCQDENKTVVKFQNAGVVCLQRGDAGVWSVQWVIIPEIVA